VATDGVEHVRIDAGIDEQLEIVSKRRHRSSDAYQVAQRWPETRVARNEQVDAGCSILNEIGSVLLEVTLVNEITTALLTTKTLPKSVVCQLTLSSRLRR